MIKNKLTRKTIAVFLLLNFLSTLFPYSAIYANNNGPNAPEASNFEPVSATDMVNLSSGDMAYVLPLLEIDGFPVTLSYHAGIPMDMESSWIGLGWNINTGTISRGVSAVPDDWNMGERLNITYLYGVTESYSVDVGVGIGKAAEVGVGLSWGSNKSLSGSVSATVGPISATAGTDGSVGVKVSASLGKTFGFKGVFDKIGETDKSSGPGFGGSLSFSNKSGFSANAGVTGQTSKNISGSMGVSVSGNGMGSSFSIGKNNGVNGENARGGSGSMSSSSYTAGDFSINTKGIYIPISIGIFSFGFGYQKTEIELAKAYSKFAFGSLYHNQSLLYHNNKNNGYLFNKLGEIAPDNKYTDYGARNTYGDVYEQLIPQKEDEFISDYRKQVEKLNFSFAGYDSYDVSATGIAGSLRPIIGENSVLVGEGYDGGSTDDANKHSKVFYHNANSSLRTTKSIGNSSNPINFVFDGQTTQDAKSTGRLLSNTSTSSLNLGMFASKNSTINNRPRSGSYVEVYTNKQIDDGASILKSTSHNLRRDQLGYPNEGIGAYKITTPDGKTYHFSQPVYHYEQMQHNFLEFKEASKKSKYNSSSKREATPFATHWLLTAITGPDFIDINNNNIADEEDYGYWVRLDHGQWSSAFTWRSPYDTKTNYRIENSQRNYSTFIDNEVEKSDPGHFMQGRKDLYYLDKIVSKEQIAYFVKDIRYDAIGSDAPYAYKPEKLKDLFGNTATNFSFKDKLLGGDVVVYEDAKYEKEFQLRLDKIVLTKNTGADDYVSVNPNQGYFRGLESKITNNNYHSGGYIYKGLGEIARKHKLHQSNKVLDADDFNNFDYSKAIKVVKFDNNHYDLAKAKSGQKSSSDHVNNPNRGRLTLKSIKFYGRGIVENANENQLYDYMPPYKFEYSKKHVKYERDGTVSIGNGEYKFVRAKKDNWGFIKGDDIDAWSLNKIETPQGGTIEIDYEEDEFKIEAFSRKYWRNNLQFKIQKENINGVDSFTIDVENQNGFAYPINFTNYFNTGERTFLDLWIARSDHAGGTFGINGSDRRSKINVRVDDNVLVSNVTSGKLTLKVKGNHINDCDDCGSECRPTWILNKLFAKKDGVGSADYYEAPRGTKARETKDSDHNMTYTLLANKMAPGTSGGGLRVKEITVKDELDNEYITAYEYLDPSTNRSSGITSFNPTYGEVFVPYQNELPGPGVMYEWVTMKAYGKVNGVKKLDSQVRYRYHTLQPVWDIFDPNIDMKDVYGNSIFKATVTEESVGQANVLAKKMHIEKDLSRIGQLISTEELNAQGQLLTKTENHHKPRYGYLEETFTSMKSVFDFNINSSGDVQDNSGQLKNRFISLSSKKEKVSAIKQIDNISRQGTTSVYYEDPDPYLGTYRTSINKMADGTRVKETKYPAYEQYGDMGPKVDNPANKNMLTQEAMSVSYVEVSPNNWKTTNASITTWNNDWIYRDENGNEPSSSTEFPIWRKHKSYVWKADLDEYGTYGRKLTANDFIWNLGAGQTQTNEEWQEVSEITRYTHFSAPVETRDINNNYASSKMADNFSKTIAGGNAKYTEMYYSGAEYPEIVNDYINSTEDEFSFTSCKINELAHTGINSIELTSANAKAFELSKNADEMRPGNYKVSFWVNSSSACENVVGQPCDELPQKAPELVFQNSVKQPEVILQSGNWILYNYIVNYETGIFDMHVKQSTGIGGAKNVIIDDFRLHPVASSMNSYVYDNNTDELRYILDANNLATEFRYDKAGRLCRTYKEVIDQGANKGGFKLINEYRYRYKNAPSNSGKCGCCETEGVVYINDKPFAVDDSYSFKVITPEEFKLNIIENDYDINSLDQIAFNAIESQPSNGSLSIRNNEVYYMPNLGFYGQDSFTYTIKDNASPIAISNPATVKIHIQKDQLIGFISMHNNVDLGHKACANFQVNIAEGSGSGKYSYYWEQIDDNGNVIGTSSNAIFYVCRPCTSGGNNRINLNIRCKITDNENPLKHLTLERDYSVACSGSSSGGGGGSPIDIEQQ